MMGMLEQDQMNRVFGKLHLKMHDHEIYEKSAL